MSTGAPESLVTRVVAAAAAAIVVFVVPSASHPLHTNVRRSQMALEGPVDDPQSRGALQSALLQSSAE